VNLDETRVVQPRGHGDVKTLQYYVRVDWGDATIGKIAEDYGLEEVHYADLRTLSVLFFWQQRFVTVYGVRRAP
jgi:hypothetical protein